MDSGCRKLTAAWVREAAQKSHDVETCDFFEGLERAATDAVRLPRMKYIRLHFSGRHALCTMDVIYCALQDLLAARSKTH